MSSQRERFRDVVLARAEAIGLTSDALIVAAGGPSTSTLTKIRALATDPRGDVLRRFDTALRWPEGAALRLWRDGSAPAPAAAASLEDFTDVELADELARRIRQREEVGNDERSAPTSAELDAAREKGLEDAKSAVVHAHLGHPPRPPASYEHPHLAVAYAEGWQAMTPADVEAQALAAAAAMADAPSERADQRAGGASDSANVHELPSAEALDPTLPADLAARTETGKSRTQRARERQDEETEGP